jgi:hypothetical protein
MADQQRVTVALRVRPLDALNTDHPTVNVGRQEGAKKATLVKTEQEKKNCPFGCDGTFQEKIARSGVTVIVEIARSDATVATSTAQSSQLLHANDSRFAVPIPAASGFYSHACINSRHLEIPATKNEQRVRLGLRSKQRARLTGSES